MFLKLIFQKIHYFSMKINENPAFHTHFIDFGGVGSNETGLKPQQIKKKMILMFDFFGKNVIRKFQKKRFVVKNVFNRIFHIHVYMEISILTAKTPENQKITKIIQN